MPIWHLALVALIQGITEFLPVSSSGHLILLPELTGLDDQGVAIDVAVHVGTLGAVVLYFWRDVALGLSGVPRLLMGKTDTPGARLAFLILIATIPALAFGFALKMTGAMDAMRNITVIGWTMLGFGLVLYWADQRGETTRGDGDFTLRDAVLIGLWQALAFIPGTSRSGATITGARFLGFNRHAGARFAMLMSIPTILASGIATAGDLAIAGNSAMLRDASIAAALAFISALLALKIMMRLLQTVSFTPYVIYRILLGITLLFLAYS